MVIYILGPCGVGKTEQSKKLRDLVWVIDADRWLLKNHRRLAFRPFMWDALFYVESCWFKTLEEKYKNKLVFVDVGGGFLVSRHAEPFFKGRICVYLFRKDLRFLFRQAKKAKPFLSGVSFEQYVKGEFSSHRKKIYENALFKIKADNKNALKRFYERIREVVICRKVAL